MSSLIRMFFKILFFPVRGILHLLTFIQKLVLMLGSVAATIIFFLFALGAAASAILGDYKTAALAFGIGMLFKLFPYIGAAVIAVLQTIAELLKQITSPHPFQDLDLEGGIYHEA